MVPNKARLRARSPEQIDLSDGGALSNGVRHDRGIGPRACDASPMDLDLVQEHRNDECSLRFMNWSSEPATESQLSRLRVFGYLADCPLTKGEAASLIKELEQVAEN